MEKYKNKMRVQVATVIAKMWMTVTMQGKQGDNEESTMEWARLTNIKV